MAAAHLRRGFDVVMPQLTVLGNLTDEYASIAAVTDAAFFEIILIADLDELVERLPVHDPGAPHPRDEFSPVELRGQMEYAIDTLVPYASTRDFAHVIDVSGMTTEASIGIISQAIGLGE
jgi:hypothetical protein